MIKYTLNI